MSGIGALYGRFIGHAAALASTCRERVELQHPSATVRQVATYGRGHGLEPYRVMHDLTTNRPYGRHIVYVGARRIGAQLSCPSAEDCRRLEYPPARFAPYEVRLSASTRMSLGVLSGAGVARRRAQKAAYYAKQKKIREARGGGSS